MRLLAKEQTIEYYLILINILVINMTKRKRELENKLKDKDKLLPNKKAYDPRPLNKRISFFITNSSENKSRGSSLYFVTPHGTIRCRSDHTRKGREPSTMTRPYMVGYFKDGELNEKIQTFEPAVGYSPFEAETSSLDILKLVKENKKRARHHTGHIITEIIHPEQFHNKNFVPKTWVNQKDVGILWSSAVNQINKAKARAYLNKHGHFKRKTIDIVIPDAKKTLKR